MEQFETFISELAGALVTDYGLTADEARAEAERIEAARRGDIEEAMANGGGVVVFVASIHRMEATFNDRELVQLRRLEVVL
jgi:hypothetical protein